jgi:glutamate-ammonia-ligase adenylyltransferase
MHLRLALIDRLLSACDNGQGPDALSTIGADLADGERRFIEHLAAGPDTRSALLNLRRIAEQLEENQPLAERLALEFERADERSLKGLAQLLAFGSEQTRILRRDPQRISFVLDASFCDARGKQALADELEQRLQALDRGADSFWVQLSDEIIAFRNDHYVRLAAAEFVDAPLEVVGAELADLADVCLETAVAAAIEKQSKRSGPPLLSEGEDRLCGLTVIAMGKYGSRELNFCSDIDIIFIYESDDGAAGQRSLHEFFGGVCRDVSSLLSEHRADGFAFRVDLRLRPEGSRGPICNSLVSAERYYETWGGPYDRLAWLKARPAAGDLALGEQMMAIMRPFVFPRAHGPDVIDQLKQLTARIRSELKEGPVAGWNVKLGHGGIRDIEFFVQALQLLHGGKQPSLRAPATLAALERLLFAGLISDDEQVELARAYELYRRIEHRAQLHAGRQTHVLPKSGQLRDLIDAHLGYEVGQLEPVLEQHRQQVATIYQTLGDEAQLDSELTKLVGRWPEKDQAAAILAEAGFKESERAAEQLELLAEKPWGPLGQARDPKMRELGAAVLLELAASPSPDDALRHFVDLALRFGLHGGLLQLLRKNESALRLLCSLFGSSDFLARILIRHPEFFDHLLLAGELPVAWDSERFAKELQTTLAEIDDPELRYGALEGFRDLQILRIGLLDIMGVLEPASVFAQLSDLAEVLLDALYRMVLEQAKERYGEPMGENGQPVSMVVYGLGKLGSREMSYGSDLDLIFITSGSGLTDGPRQLTSAEFFVRVAQRLINALTTGFVHGALYHVDTRLRPSGSQGTLVVSFSAFEEYHRRAQLWERQVLIKARPVAGDRELGERIEAWREQFVYRSDLGDERMRLAAEIKRLRMRIEKELAGENLDFYNLKLGEGGLLDIEFVAQFYQLLNGGAHPSLRVRGTEAALAAAADVGLVEKTCSASLQASYRFLRQLEGRLRIVRGSSAEKLPKSPSGVEVVARRLGLRSQEQKSAGALLLDRYRKTSTEVRSLFSRLVQ